MFFRRSYDDLFVLLKQVLEHPSRRLSLSAEWVMSDFEHNIRASWLDIFPSVRAKGCHFHYAKVSSVLYNTVHHFIFLTIFFFSYLSEKIAHLSTTNLCPLKSYLVFKISSHLSHLLNTSCLVLVKVLA